MIKIDGQIEKYWESQKHPEFPYWNQVMIGAGLLSAGLMVLAGWGLVK